MNRPRHRREDFAVRNATGISEGRLLDCRSGVVPQAYFIIEKRSAARKFAVPIEAVSRTAGVKYGRVSLSYKLEELLKSHFGAVD